MTTLGEGRLKWGVALRALHGETECGDRHLVVPTEAGWLLAVVDGLGHGPKAAEVSGMFIDVVERHSKAPSVDELIRVGHQALRSTRGVVTTLVAINSRKNLLQWLGVGNVEGVLRHKNHNPATEYVTQRGGIVGYRLPELQPSYLQLLDGDIIALATDGIDSGFVDALTPLQTPEVLAERILDRYAKATDDALVLIAHWHAGSEKE